MSGLGLSRFVFGTAHLQTPDVPHPLSGHFDALASNINPTKNSFSVASSQYNTLKSYLEQNVLLQRHLKPKCLTHGSYDRHTATYSINDIDVVLWCQNLSFPGIPRDGTFGGYGSFDDEWWGRDRIFKLVESVLTDHGVYKTKLIPTKPDSMCIKLDMGIKIEILPVVSRSNSQGFGDEPFYLWRPEDARWEEGYAQRHQEKLSEKNAPAISFVLPTQPDIRLGTDGNFIPTVKMLKHLNTYHKLDAVSFHIECLLYSLDNTLFWFPPSIRTYLVLQAIGSMSSETWIANQLKTPCGDRLVFSASSSQHWRFANWIWFQSTCSRLANEALRALTAYRREDAIAGWQALFGSEYFPSSV